MKAGLQCVLSCAWMSDSGATYVRTLRSQKSQAGVGTFFYLKLTLDLPPLHIAPSQPVLARRQS